jgi:hypothetical protein
MKSKPSYAKLKLAEKMILTSVLEPIWLAVAPATFTQTIEILYITIKSDSNDVKITKILFS